MTKSGLIRCDDLTAFMEGFEVEQSMVEAEHYALSDVEFSPIGESAVTEGLEPPLSYGYPSVVTDQQYSRGKPVAATWIESLEATQVDKAFCSACGFVVKVEGHALRCRPPSALPAYLSNMAWIGDACWDLFVRRAVIQMGLPKESGKFFTSVQFFSQHMEEIVGLVDLGRVPAEDAAIHSRAAYVKAALAVSAFCRVRLAMLAGREFKKWAPILWRHCAVITLEWENDFVPAASLDGFCYLDLIPVSQHKTVSRELKHYPKWARVKELVPKDASGVVYYILLDGIYHVSLVPYHGMRKYEGPFVALPFNGRHKIGGMKTINFTVRVIGKEVNSEWPDEMKRDARAILDTTRALRDTGRAVVTTQRYWDRFSRFFDAPGELGLKNMRGTLDQGMNAFVAIMQVASYGGMSIGSSGVFSCTPLGYQEPKVSDDDELDDDFGFSPGFSDEE